MASAYCYLWKVIQRVQYLSYEENKNIFEDIGGILIKAKCIPLSQSYKFYQTLKKNHLSIIFHIFAAFIQQIL